MTFKSPTESPPTKISKSLFHFHEFLSDLGHLAPCRFPIGPFLGRKKSLFFLLYIFAIEYSEFKPGNYKITSMEK